MRSSLEEVAKRAASGVRHPRVNTWARNTLAAASKRGETVKSHRDRARVLLGAVQKKLWVPDPVGTEYIAGAHLLACDDETDGEVCIRAADCDELCVVLAAALSSVGIYTMIVGHAYDKQQRIEHVLCAVHLEDRWHYADPSTKLPLGQCVTPFSRERLLSMPNVQVLCDQQTCLSTRPFDPGDLNFVDRGVFVGVDGPPSFTFAGLASSLAWLSEAPMMQWLGQALVDLKDPATMIEVKRMMGLIRPGYTNTSSTWSPSDWDAYAFVAATVAGDLKINKEGSVAYVDGSNVVSGKWPPEGTLGFPSLLGIQNMAEDLVTMKVLKSSEVKSTFPKIASYGQNVAGVTAPNFGTEAVAKRGGASPLLWGLLALGGVGIAIAAAGRRDELAENRAREPVDEAAADELLLYLDNDARFSPDSSAGIGRAVIVNQLKKWRRGTYDASRAPKAWLYVVDSAAQGYAREFGGQWHRLFNKPTRESVATELARRFERDAADGQLDYIVT